MSKTQFIAWLETLQTDGEVLVFNPDSFEWCPVTGGTSDAQAIKLYDDQDSPSYEE